MSHRNICRECLKEWQEHAIRREHDPMIHGPAWVPLDGAVLDNYEHREIIEHFQNVLYAFLQKMPDLRWGDDYSSAQRTLGPLKKTTAARGMQTVKSPKGKELAVVY